MARLNEPPISASSACASSSTETIETLRKKLVRQNRDLARSNNVRALRIRELESDCTCMLSENLGLHTRILELERRLEDNHARRIADHALEVKARLEAQLLEFGSVLAGLGLEPPRKRRQSSFSSPRGSRPMARLSSSSGRRTSFTRPSPSQRRLRDVARDVEELGHIAENRPYARMSMNSDQIRALRSEAEEDHDDSLESPELGPPPWSIFVPDERSIPCSPLKSPSPAAKFESAAVHLGSSPTPAARSPRPTPAISPRPTPGMSPRRRGAEIGKHERELESDEREGAEGEEEGAEGEEEGGARGAEVDAEGEGEDAQAGLRDASQLAPASLTSNGTPARPVVVYNEGNDPAEAKELVLCSPTTVAPLPSSSVPGSPVRSDRERGGPLAVVTNHPVRTSSKRKFGAGDDVAHPPPPPPSPSLSTVRSKGPKTKIGSDRGGGPLLPPTVRDRTSDRSLKELAILRREARERTAAPAGAGGGAGQRWPLAAKSANEDIGGGGGGGNGSPVKKAKTGVDHETAKRPRPKLKDSMANVALFEVGLAESEPRRPGQKQPRRQPRAPAMAAAALVVMDDDMAPGPEPEEISAPAPAPDPSPALEPGHAPEPGADPPQPRAAAPPPPPPPPPPAPAPAAGPIPPASADTTSAVDTAARPSRRGRGAISYAEPNLRDKMRRPTKELVDAVSGEGRYRRGGAGGAGPDVDDGTPAAVEAVSELTAEEQAGDAAAAVAAPAITQSSRTRTSSALGSDAAAATEPVPSGDGNENHQQQQAPECGGGGGSSAGTDAAVLYKTTRARPAAPPRRSSTTDRPRATTRKRSSAAAYSSSVDSGAIGRSSPDEAEEIDPVAVAVTVVEATGRGVSMRRRSMML